MDKKNIHAPRADPDAPRVPAIFHDLCSSFLQLVVVIDVPVASYLGGVGSLCSGSPVISSNTESITTFAQFPSCGQKFINRSWPLLPVQSKRMLHDAAISFLDWLALWSTILVKWDFRECPRDPNGLSNTADKNLPRCSCAGYNDQCAKNSAKHYNFLGGQNGRAMSEAWFNQSKHLHPGQDSKISSPPSGETSSM